MNRAGITDWGEKQAWFLQCQLYSVPLCIKSQRQSLIFYFHLKLTGDFRHYSWYHHQQHCYHFIYLLID